MPVHYEEHCRPDGPSSDQNDVLWEGEILTSGRKGTSVKARVIECQDAFIDAGAFLGAHMKFQTWDEKTREWHVASPHSFNAASLVVALAATNPPLPK